jgi:hypothetical protein
LKFFGSEKHEASNFFSQGTQKGDFYSYFWQFVAMLKNKYFIFNCLYKSGTGHAFGKRDTADDFRVPLSLPIRPNGVQRCPLKTVPRGLRDTKWDTIAVPRGPKMASRVKI